ncbi:MAG: MerR family transcriptional regulator [Acidimicrobiales bacterium]|nr:MerR family transcriptional regulator [Acidimicrobiales bacterium]
MSDEAGRAGLATYQIGEVASRIGLSQRTIRHYDDLGIVKPSARTAGGFRLYTQTDLDRFQLIKPFKPLGIGLDEARVVTGALAVLDDVASAPAAVELARAELRRVLALVATRQAELEEAFAASRATVERLQQALDATTPALADAVGS